MLCKVHCYNGCHTKDCNQYCRLNCGGVPCNNVCINADCNFDAAAFQPCTTCYTSASGGSGCSGKYNIFIEYILYSKNWNK